MCITTTKEELYNVNFDKNVSLYLPQLVQFLERKNIMVNDSQNIIPLLVENINLYDHFNSTTKK